MTKSLCVIMLATVVGCSGKVPDGGDSENRGSVASGGTEQADSEQADSEQAPAPTPEPGPAGQPDAADPSSCAVDAPVLVGTTSLQRLSRAQYNNTVRDLLGILNEPAAALSPDERVGPFVSNSRTPITDLLVEQYQEIAIAIAAELSPRRTELSGCDLSLGGDCPQTFVEAIGYRLYRRPLEGDEVTSYLSLYDQGNEEGPAVGFELVVETMLQSPFFLYHVEQGQGAAPSLVSPLTPHELASRLSYFLWDTAPDDQLLSLADTGTLGDAAVMAEQLERMLDDERAGAMIGDFHSQWLKVGEMTDVEKDPELYPEFSLAMREAMVDELEQFADYVVREGDALMSSLFTSTATPFEPELLTLYGLEAPTGLVAGEIFQLDPTQRSGLLTRAAFLATHAHRDQTSPVHRGMIVRENLFCQPLDAPPANVNNVPPSPTPATSTRERFAQHSEDPVCATCHMMMDPIGLGFENYGPLGEFRSADGPQEVDASGELIFVDDATAGNFDGALELSQKLSTSPDLASCMANQWFRFALGRVESEDDLCSLLEIQSGFSESGNNIRDLIALIASSEAFRSVRLEASSEEM